MAGSVNKVILLGNVGKDPEVRLSADGKKIVNLSLATSETWKDKAGERQEKTEWHRVVIFNQGLAGVAEQYVKKGSKLYLSGSLKTRKYTGQDGAERRTTEVVLGAYDGELVLLDGKDKASSYPPPATADDYDDRTTGFTPADYQRAKDGDLNDEIPF
jgi:single-strand DNA-binding protein